MGEMATIENYCIECKQVARDDCEERGHVVGTLGTDTSNDATPSQPLAAGGEWRVQQVLPGEPRAIFDSENRLVATAISGDLAHQIASDHTRAALVEQLVEALHGLGWHSQNGVDSCWCHVKSEPYADHTKQCEQIQAAVNVVRKEQEG